MSRSISQLDAKLASSRESPARRSWKHFPLISGRARHPRRKETAAAESCVRDRTLRESLAAFSRDSPGEATRVVYLSLSCRCVAYIWKALTRRKSDEMHRSLKFHCGCPRRSVASALWVPRVSSCRALRRIMTSRLRYRYAYICLEWSREQDGESNCRRQYETERELCPALRGRVNGERKRDREKEGEAVLSK